MSTQTSTGLGSLRSAATILAAGAILCAAATTQAAPQASTPAPASAPAPAPQGAPPDAQSQSRFGAARKEAGEIVTQPARDVGISKSDIPPALVKAAQDPYGLQGLKTCKQYAAALAELNPLLGPDYKSGDQYRENRMAKLAAAGGKTVVNSLIPFRGLVREVTGAAPADRRLRAAVEAGYARRGFLRGMYTARNCRPRMQ